MGRETSRVIKEATPVANRGRLRVEADPELRQLRLRYRVHNANSLVETVENVESLSGFINREARWPLTHANARGHHTCRGQHADACGAGRRHIDGAVRLTHDIRGQGQAQCAFGHGAGRIAEVNMRVQIGGAH